MIFLWIHHFLIPVKESCNRKTNKQTKLKKKTNKQKTKNKQTKKPKPNQTKPNQNKNRKPNQTKPKSQDFHQCYHHKLEISSQIEIMRITEYQRKELRQYGRCMNCRGRVNEINVIDECGKEGKRIGLFLWTKHAIFYSCSGSLVSHQLP